MRKKGFTVIELVVSITLTSIVMILLFNMIFSLKDLYINAVLRTELLNKQTIMNQNLNKLLAEKKIKGLYECGEYCIRIAFSDQTNTKLEIDKKNKIFSIGEYKTKLINGSEFGDIRLLSSTVENVEKGKNDSYLTLEIPVKHSLLSNEEYGINTIYQYEMEAMDIGTVDVIDMAESINRLQAEVNSLKTANSALTTNVNNLVAANDSKTTEIDNLKKLNTSLNTEITNLKNTNTSQNTEITNLKSTNTTLNTKVTNLTTEITNLKSTNTSLNTEISTLKTTSSSQATKISNLETNTSQANTFLKSYPVGSIYISVNSTNPGSTYGGTWVAYGTGRTLVGVDTSQTEFNTVSKTGGNKNLQSHSHTGTTNNSGEHVHDGITWGGGGTPFVFSGLTGNDSTWDLFDGLSTPKLYNYSATAHLVTAKGGIHSHTFTTSTAGTGDSGNLQPYITVYMWKRTK